MTEEAFKKLKSIISKNKNNVKWICATCELALLSASSTSCDGCLKWYDYKCAGIKRGRKIWVCNSCLVD